MGTDGRSAEPDLKQSSPSSIENVQRHSLPTEVSEYIAYSVDTNLRDMEGVLNSLMFPCDL